MSTFVWQVVDADTLETVQDVLQQPSILAVAVFMGSVRLIDNIHLYKEHS